MVITEQIQIDGVDYIKHYSDRNLYLRQTQTDDIYSEAIDVVGSLFTYIETDEEIISSEDSEMTEIEQKAKAYDIITGGEEIETN